MKNLAVNFERLKAYQFERFDTETIIFYEWLLIKSKSFGFGWFFYSQKRIISETGLRRAKIESVIKNFSELEILKTEVRGYPRQTYFFVNIQKLVDQKIFRLFYKKSNLEIETFYNNFKHDFITKLTEAPEPKPKTPEKVLNFVSELQAIFNERREAAKTKKNWYQSTSLAVTHSATNGIEKAMNRFDKQALKNSFVAFVDWTLDQKKNERQPKFILNYWVTFRDGEFPVINTFLDLYNTCYILSKTK